MPCSTCSHTMHGCGHGIFHCPRCGTMQIGEAIYVPALVRRVRQLRSQREARGLHDVLDKQDWHQLGIDEAIGPK